MDSSSKYASENSMAYGYLALVRSQPEIVTVAPSKTRSENPLLPRLQSRPYSHGRVSEYSYTRDDGESPLPVFILTVSVNDRSAFEGAIVT